jgi:hypothetical protein
MAFRVSLQPDQTDSGAAAPRQQQAISERVTVRFIKQRIGISTNSSQVLHPLSATHTGKNSHKPSRSVRAS